MNHHADMQKLLAAYCGGDLEPAERMGLEEHLAGCASCRTELADLQTALRLIRTTPESEPPPWLATRIMARVREQQREQRGWWQRIFHPLRIKLPLEIATLLLVCVSGYYLARDVETGLNQPALQRELPAATPETGKSFTEPGQAVPAAAPPASAPLPPATRTEHRPAEHKTSQTSAPKPVVQDVPLHLPPVPGKSSPQPAFAPAPPVMKEERGAPAGESAHGDTGPFTTDRSLAPAERTLPAAAPMQKKAYRKGEHDMAGSEGTRSASGAAAGGVLPKIRIRLHLIDPASPSGALKEAVIRSGGSVLDDHSFPPDTMKARLPSTRLSELLERLGHLGRIAERPQTRDLTGTVELEIDW